MKSDLPDLDQDGDIFGRFKRMFKPSHRHIRSGDLYVLLGHGRMEADLAPVVIYQAVGSGSIWVRGQDEFEAKFQMLAEFKSGLGGVIERKATDENDN